ncbi:hypothetical protein [Rhodanobacter lindaniclasticus]
MSTEEKSNPLEELAQKLVSNNLVVLNANECQLAAAALRYLAQHVAENATKRGRGNPTFKRKFNYTFAVSYYHHLREQNMSKTKAYDEVASFISKTFPDSEKVDADAVRIAIQGTLKKSSKPSGTGKK